MRLRSPLSRREWDLHGCVRDVNADQNDPELVVVNAEPPDVAVLLRLREWIDGIQAELDTSWAVLGETYGRFEGLNRLGLSLCRVGSNIDDGNFGARLGYVPHHVKFGVAEADLLSLMVRPLYGNKPKVGIREMIQNSIDAVRELRVYGQQHQPNARVCTA